MAGLARRIAPAAALGGLAVIIVGVADPAIANLGASDAGTEASTPLAVAAGSTTESDATEQDSTAADATPSDPTAQSDASTACSTGETVTGEAAMTRWGPVQVEATVDNGTVCEVRAVAWPADDRKSEMINAYAIPILDEAATASQGTQIDYISGATYTSDAYAQSLQSILDQL